MAKNQGLYIDNKFIKSIKKAAKLLNIPYTTLHKRLENKKAIVEKGVLIERAEEPIKEKVKKETGRTLRVPIFVDGVAYDSIGEAEQKCGFPRNVLSGALKLGQQFYKGHKIGYVYPSEMWKRKNKHRKEYLTKKMKTKRDGVKVYCVTTNETFNTIEEAAAFAKADGWTMSRKMETDGCFIDELERKYVRLSPMQSKRTYEPTTPKLQRTVTETYTRETKIVPKVVKDAITDKITQLLKDKEIYEEIIELLNYGGFSSLELKK